MGKNDNFHVHCVHKLFGFHANCTQIAPDMVTGKIILIMLFSNRNLEAYNYIVLSISSFV